MFFPTWPTGHSLVECPWLFQSQLSFTLFLECAIGWKKGNVRNTDFKTLQVRVEIENISANSFPVDLYHQSEFSSITDQMFQRYIKCLWLKTQVKQRKQSGGYIPPFPFHSMGVNAIHTQNVVSRKVQLTLEQRGFELCGAHVYLDFLKQKCNTTARSWVV